MLAVFLRWLKFFFYKTPTKDTAQIPLFLVFNEGTNAKIDVCTYLRLTLNENYQRISSVKRQNGSRADQPRMEMAPGIFSRRDRNAERQLQGQEKLICDIYSHIKAFEVKLALLLEQVKNHNFIHLPATQNLSAENPAVLFPAVKCVEALEMLKAEFGVRLRELHINAKEIRLFQNPFVADTAEAQPSYQFELAELQNCDVLKDVFKPSSLIHSMPPSQTTRTLT